MVLYTGLLLSLAASKMESSLQQRQQCSVAHWSWIPGQSHLQALTGLLEWSIPLGVIEDLERSLGILLQRIVMGGTQLKQLENSVMQCVWSKCSAAGAYRCC